MAELTAERLRELLHYSPETGIFTWRVTRCWRTPAGTELSYRNEEGYVQVRLFRRLYRAHRLAWLYVHGVWPTRDIDHANGNRADNRIDNLREANGAINQENRRRANKNNRTSGLLGASFDRTKGRWMAQIMKAGKTIFLGYFQTPEEAHEAYVAAKRTTHEGNTL